MFSSIFEDLFILILCVSVLSTHMYVCTMCVRGYRGQKMVFEVLELELQVVVVAKWLLGTEPGSIRRVLLTTEVPVL